MFNYLHRLRKWGAGGQSICAKSTGIAAAPVIDNITFPWTPQYALHGLLKSLWREAHVKLAFKTLWNMQHYNLVHIGFHLKCWIYPLIPWLCFSLFWVFSCFVERDKEQHLIFQLFVSYLTVCLTISRSVICKNKTKQTSAPLSSPHQKQKNNKPKHTLKTFRWIWLIA